MAQLVKVLALGLCSTERHNFEPYLFLNMEVIGYLHLKKSSEHSMFIIL